MKPYFTLPDSEKQLISEGLSWEICHKRVETRKHALPAISSPGTVGCDDHLSTVIGVGVVHVELQAFPLMTLDQREKVL